MGVRRGELRMRWSHPGLCEVRRSLHKILRALCSSGNALHIFESSGGSVLPELAIAERKLG